jgi:hypothetical protein
VSLLERLRKECKLTVYPVAKRYLVTKQFTTGDLKGLSVSEQTAVLFEVGFRCSYHPWCGPGYEVTKVVELSSITNPEDWKD